MAKSLMFVEGLDGQVELLADRVVIHRKGLWNALKFGMNAKREMPLSAITEVALRPAGMLFFGEIEFIGGAQHGTSFKKKINLSAVKFKRDKNDVFEAFKEKVFQIMNQQAAARK